MRINLPHSIINKSLAILAATAAVLLTPVSAFAVTTDPLAGAMLRFDRMQLSTANTRVLVVVKPNKTATENEVRLTFNTGFTVNNAVSSAITVTTVGVST